MTICYSYHIHLSCISAYLHLLFADEQSICMIGLFLYNSIVKYASIYHLAALMDSKRAFMRYIAHELRTPLNSASLGLKLINTTMAGAHHHQHPMTSNLSTKYHISMTYLRNLCDFLIFVLWISPFRTLLLDVSITTLHLFLLPVHDYMT